MITPEQARVLAEQTADAMLAGSPHTAQVLLDAYGDLPTAVGALQMAWLNAARLAGLRPPPGWTCLGEAEGGGLLFTAPPGTPWPPEGG